jgi:hypothetical protein
MGLVFDRTKSSGPISPAPNPSFMNDPAGRGKFTCPLPMFTFSFGLAWDRANGVGKMTAAAKEPWQVGIVQNVLFESIFLKYQNMYVRQEFPGAILDSEARVYQPFVNDPVLTNVPLPGVSVRFVPLPLCVADIWLTAAGYTNADDFYDPFLAVPAPTNQPSVLSMGDAPNYVGALRLDDGSQLLGIQYVVAIQLWLIAIGPGVLARILANTDPFSLIALMTVDPINTIGEPTFQYGSLARSGIVTDRNILDGFVSKGINLGSIGWSYGGHFHVGFGGRIPVLSGMTADARLDSWKRTGPHPVHE